MIRWFWRALRLKDGPLNSLYLTHSILHFGLGMIGIFTPLYILRITGNFLYLPVFYGTVSIVVLISLLCGSKIIPLLGAHRSVLLANFFRVLNLSLLLLAPRFLPLLIGAAVFEGLIVPTYWITYHTVFTGSGRSGNYGREIAWMGVFVSVVSALAPFFGGLVVSTMGFPTLYGLGMLVILLSSIPIFKMEDHLGFRSIPAREILRETFSPSWRPMLTGFFGNRLEIVFATIVWPFFALEVLESFTTLGAVTSVFTVAGVLFMIVAGQAVDAFGRRRVLPVSALLLTPFWLATGFVSSGAVLAVLNGYRGAVAPFYGIAVESLFYRFARLDPFLTILKREVSIHLSIMASLFLIALFWVLFPENWPILFIPAALGMLLSIVMVKAK
uniref:Major facilitator superfamily (MFS) profile domain-containing protein n=1 Tax=candidate division WWE3 bacterium TaxID=2053526 RepID=A0A831Z189_UNCKA